MFFEHIATHGDCMHDRENAGFLEIGLLGFPVIGKQPHHTRIVLQERLWRAGGKRCIQIAVEHHLCQRSFGDYGQIHAVG